MYKKMFLYVFFKRAQRTLGAVVYMQGLYAGFLCMVSTGWLHTLNLKITP